MLCIIAAVAYGRQHRRNFQLLAAGLFPALFLPALPQQLQRMVDVTNHQQLLTAQMIADSFDNKVEQIGRLLILSYPDLISEADHESAYRHLIAIAPQIVSIERAHVDSLSQTQRSDLTAVLENRKIEAHVTKSFSQSNGWFLRLKVQEQNLDTVIIATINASELLEMGTPAADSSPFAIRILTKGGRRVYGLNEDSIDLARLHLLPLQTKVQFQMSLTVAGVKKFVNGKLQFFCKVKSQRKRRVVFIIFNRIYRLS